MAMLDDLEDKGDMSGRMQELEQRARDNNLDDKGREELARLRERFNRQNDDNTQLS